MFKRRAFSKTCSEKYSCRKCHGKHSIAICTFSKPGAHQVNCSHAFEHVGVNYAGPVFYKNVNKESKELLKCYYILLITCAVTRTVHIEVTPDVRSYSLRLPLIRFFSREGVSKLVISDFQIN